MTHSNRRWRRCTLAVALALALPGTAMADAKYDALKQQVDLLQQQLAQVQQTLAQYEQQSRASKQDVAQLKQEVAQAAIDSSEWKNTDSIVHLAGYGDVTYSGGKGDDVDNAFTAARFNPIFHYQYKDLVMLEAELELAVEEDGGTEIGLEYMTIDYFLNDYVVLVAGKFLSPIGQFRQNLHPSWINKLPTAPSGFGHDQAAPISDLGFQARGGFPLADESVFVNYAAFVGNGPVLEIEDDEIHAIEAVGRTANDSGSYTWGGRIGLLPIPMLEIGLSGGLGKAAGEDESSAKRDYNVYGADVAYQWQDLSLRGEFIKQSVGSSSNSEVPESADWRAWYAQASYQFLSNKWEGVLRYSDYDANVDSQDQQQWSIGLNYLIAPNAMIKGAYNVNHNDDGSDADDDNFQLQASYGF